LSRIPSVRFTTTWLITRRSISIGLSLRYFDKMYSR
jgi:hypothetical protein